jgi:hypothetical protein
MTFYLICAPSKHKIVRRNPESTKASHSYEALFAYLDLVLNNNYDEFIDYWLNIENKSLKNGILGIWISIDLSFVISSFF